mgnify:FL=1
MKEAMMRVEDQPGPVPKNREMLIQARYLGEILRNNPKIQSNSPELYLLTYLKRFGSDKV